MKRKEAAAPRRAPARAPVEEKLSAPARKLLEMIEVAEAAMRAATLAELEIADEAGSVHFSREAPPASSPPGGWPDISTLLALAQPARAPAPAAVVPAAAPAAPPPPAATAPKTNLVEVRTPLAGTFYRAPAPGAEPFVLDGQEVEANQTLAIVEAMKMMNQIASPRRGRVAAIRVENGDPVAEGDLLILLEPL